MKQWRKKFLFSFAIFHLVILASGMTHLRQKFSPLGKTTIGLYEAITGAGGGFGFFSPNVGQQLTFKFFLQSDTGQREEVFLKNLVSKEVAIRMGNMFRLFTFSYGSEKHRRSIAASFCAYVFDRLPQAREVTMEVYAFQLPSLVEYVRGDREHSDLVYHITFKKKEL